jgi:two-component system, NtrC family, nitrogen regulation response regulator NtrX
MSEKSEVSARPLLLVADDDASFRGAFRQMLTSKNYRIQEAGTPEEVISAVGSCQFDLITLDLEWQSAGRTGVDILKKIREIDPLVPVIMITGHATLGSAIEATRLGAFDYLEKVADREKTLLTIRNAIESGHLRRGLKIMLDRLKDEWQLVGVSQALQNVRETISRVASKDTVVLIEGESGTGKELAAHLIHLESSRNTGPFKVIHGSELGEYLGQDMLFGHKRGAFTGSVGTRAGLIEAAEGGTLFLDDVNDLPLAVQPQLLRLLQAGDFMPLGSDERQQANVRFVAGSNKPILSLVQQGKFREDLFYRLNVVMVVIPPLRERKEDIPILAKHFLDRHAHRLLGREVEVETGWLDPLVDYNWPGNVRELENRLIAVLSYLRPDEGIDRARVQAALTLQAKPQSNSNGCLKDREASFRKECLIRELAGAEGSVTKAAERLGIDRSHLYRLINEFDLMQYVKQLTA